MTTTSELDVYSARDIAGAAGVHPADVRALIEAGAVQAIDGTRYFTAEQAVQAVRLLAGQAGVDRPVFRPAVSLRRQPGMPLAMSGTLHAAMVAVIAAATSLGVASTQARSVDPPEHLRMVFLVAPGSGGGGGGGGHQDPVPPPRAERKGPDPLRSPVTLKHAPKPVMAPPRPIPPPRVDPPPVIEKAPEPPPAAKADAMKPVFAPVAPAAADKSDRNGVPTTAAPVSASAGPGTGSGVGSGQGSGAGQGQGSGIGAGSGGGTGGGPYRPGAGISAPSILREVRPDYTDEGRRRAIEGDVVLEIVVRSDGSVGSVKTLQGLGAGLDERAAEAVRQWRFNPARRYGTPVDVIVEVAVEFKLR